MSDQSYESMRVSLRHLRVKENFDHKYQDKGGVAELIRMVGAGSTQRQTADHFGLQPQRISQLYTIITGKRWPYGPGPGRNYITTQQNHRQDSEFAKSGLAAAIGEAEKLVTLLNQSLKLVEAGNPDDSEKLAGLAMTRLEHVATEISGAFQSDATSREL